MADKAVELHVAGQSCRVVTTADEHELRELVLMVEDKLKGLTGPGRPVTTQTVLLAAVALANDVREQQARADAIADRAKKALRSLLSRVDCALEEGGPPNGPGKKKKSGRSRPNKRS